MTAPEAEWNWRKLLVRTSEMFSNLGNEKDHSVYNPTKETQMYLIPHLYSLCIFKGVTIVLRTYILFYSGLAGSFFFCPRGMLINPHGLSCTGNRWVCQISTDQNAQWLTILRSIALPAPVGKVAELYRLQDTGKVIWLARRLGGGVSLLLPLGRLLLGKDCAWPLLNPAGRGHPQQLQRVLRAYKLYVARRSILLNSTLAHSAGCEAFLLVMKVSPNVTYFKPSRSQQRTLVIKTLARFLSESMEKLILHIMNHNQI